MKPLILALCLTAPFAVDAQELRSPDAFADIAEDDARAAALFDEMAKVLTHPRCLNCHPVGDRPTQGDDMHPHMPPIVRGENGFGPAGVSCSTCHGTENRDFLISPGGIPGHEPWHLAPVSMGWQGLSNAEICAQIKDPARNGDRTLEDIYTHNATDGLVGWGWTPGAGRTPAPGSQEQFGALTRAWIDSGAACPT
ncbi:hypothetical protein [Tropicibacter naphthalenivorans]|uniref:Cytochrome c domain-containing protein n=1 Tax=Tropicibacter naphthalenivorans TaxID=441103 RepID=A0A0N7LYJ1_9RHOB|nr:hypothetical protein [Tropicibacter naphthalenivorans]CUH75009.1 hypothetical protein TRN7648_00199 [Tropicibacter naphthalenivorans]SMC47461.1 hypothetical protein SAMN04488093_101681 [Tropicibacter naphthalenivorans]